MDSGSFSSVKIDFTASIFLHLQFLLLECWMLNKNDLMKTV